MATCETMAILPPGETLPPQTNDGSKIKSLGTFSAASVKSLEEAAAVQKSGSLPTSFGQNERRQKKQLQYIPSKEGVLEVEDEDFYHGYMTRSESERLLTKQGQFLVRKTDVLGEHCFVMSVFDVGRVKHLRIRQTRRHGSFYLYDLCFDSIGAMIAYHRRSGRPVHPSGLLIDSHVKRENWELYHEQIDLSGGKLGSGEFGEVMAGFLTRGVFSSAIPVAVKTLRGEHMSSDDRVEFLREANVMLKLKHKHIVRLYGVATQRQPIMIVMEKANGGSLLSRLKKDTTLSMGAKQTFCFEIADGMAYLEQEEVIHRDLAARNVLLSGNCCKISDFGLSLLGKMHRETKLSRVPVRWLAPETLGHGIYSSKTDVWSFGVVIYEIFANGGVPYADVKKLALVAQQVRKGRRLVLPEEAPAVCKETMRLCFETDSNKRTSFADLLKRQAPTSLRLKLTALFK